MGRKRTQQRNNELSCLDAVLGILSQPRDQDGDLMLDEALNNALLVLDVEAGAIHLLDEEGDQLSIRAHRGLAEEYLQNIARLNVGQGIIGRVVKSGRQTVVNVVGDDPKISDMLGAGRRALACVPLKSRNGVLGTLTLASHAANKLNDNAIGLLSAMGEAVGIAVENATVARRLREANARLNRLVERAITGGLDIRFENPHLVKCWVETGCDYTACPCHGSENLRCWQVAGTLCGGEVQGQFAQKLKSCTECEVYQKSCERDEMTMMGERFNNMIFLLEREVQHREQISEELLGELISIQEEERKRISRELHDEASQALAALAISLEGIEHTLPTRYRDEKKRLGTLKERAIRILEDIRSLALELRPSALDDFGLSMAIDWYAKSHLGKRGLDVQVQVVGNGRKLPSPTETMLFRIVQEALANVVMHAEASEVRVRLEVKGSMTILQVEDNGKGFDVEAALAGTRERQSLGLRAMAERAALLGGTLTIRSQPGQGTSLRVEVPFRGEDSQQ